MPSYLSSSQTEVAQASGLRVTETSSPRETASRAESAAATPPSPAGWKPAPPRKLKSGDGSPSPRPSPPGEGEPFTALRDFDAFGCDGASWELLCTRFQIASAVSSGDASMNLIGRNG